MVSTNYGLMYLIKWLLQVRSLHTSLRICEEIVTCTHYTIKDTWGDCNLHSPYIWDYNLQLPHYLGYMRLQLVINALLNIYKEIINCTAHFIEDVWRD